MNSLYWKVEGNGKRKPGIKGAGSGIPKVVGTGWKRVKFPNISLYFHKNGTKRWDPPQKEAGVKGSGLTGGERIKKGTAASGACWWLKNLKMDDISPQQNYTGVDVRWNFIKAQSDLKSYTTAGNFSLYIFIIVYVCLISIRNLRTSGTKISR